MSNRYPRSMPWQDEWAVVDDRGQQCPEFLLTEHVEGVTLSEFVRHQGTLSPPQLLSLCAALQQAEETHPEAAMLLTPDSVVLSMSGPPRFGTTPHTGVGARGCLWYAVTGKKPLRQPLPVASFRKDLPRSLEKCLDAFFQSRRELSDVISVLHRMASPQPLQLGISPLVLQEYSERSERVGSPGVTWMIILFSVTSVFLAGWQIDVNLNSVGSATGARAAAATTVEACRWDRLAYQRQRAITGGDGAGNYSVENSPAFHSEHQLLADIENKQVRVSGLTMSFDPEERSSRKCADPVGMFGWLPEPQTSLVDQQRIEALVSGHWQSEIGEAERWKEPVKQVLDVQLRFQEGSWLLEHITVEDEQHAQ